MKWCVFADPNHIMYPVTMQNADFYTTPVISQNNNQLAFFTLLTVTNNTCNDGNILLDIL